MYDAIFSPCILLYESLVLPYIAQNFDSTPSLVTRICKRWGSAEQYSLVQCWEVTSTGDDFWPLDGGFMTTDSREISMPDKRPSAHKAAA
jgi:hypothetical protein